MLGVFKEGQQGGAEGDEVREDHGSVHRHSKDFGFEAGEMGAVGRL